MRPILLSILLFVISSQHLKSQAIDFDQSGMRVMFLLDGSFSMMEKWNTETKFELAADILVDLMDSLFISDPNIYFGVRVFGHQTGMNKNDCLDTKLEIDFDQRNIRTIKRKLKRMFPKGWSPIAYSLEQAAKDMPNDGLTNLLIMVSDGGETCKGDPCAIVQEMKKRMLNFSSFVVGLGDSPFLKQDLECIGTYKAVTEKQQIKKILLKAIDEVTTKTTAQFYFTDSKGKRSITDFEVSISNSKISKPQKTFIHALNEYGKSDTISMSVFGKYELVAHTRPPITKSGIELSKFKHTIFETSAAQGYLKVELDGSRGNANFQCVVRSEKDGSIVEVQNLDSRLQYLPGNYEFEMTSLPKRTFVKQIISAGDTTVIRVPRSGAVAIKVAEPTTASIYELNGKDLIKVYEFPEINGYQTLYLLPGTYKFVYKSLSDPSMQTLVKEFQILSGRAETIEIMRYEN